MNNLSDPSTHINILLVAILKYFEMILDKLVFDSLIEQKHADTTINQSYASASLILYVHCTTVKTRV